MSFNLINDSILQLRKLRLRDRKCLVQLQQRGPARVGVGKVSLSPPGKVFWVEGTAWAKAQRLGMWFLVGPLAKTTALDEEMDAEVMGYRGSFVTEHYHVLDLVSALQSCSWGESTYRAKKKKSTPSPQEKVICNVLKVVITMKPTNLGHYLFFLLAMAHGMFDLSSPARARTHASCSGDGES